MTTHSNPTPSGTRRRPSPWAILVVPLAAAIVLTLFAWPSARMEPRDLPVAVAGPPAATAAMEHRLEAREGAFDVHTFATEAAARDAIADREVYGALVATPAGPKVLVASAASPAVAQLLTNAAAQSAGAGEGAAPVDDVVPASHAAAALPASVLPLVLAGILTGVLSGVLASGSVARRAGLVLTGSVLAGLAATGIVQSWLGVVDGDWLANAGALSLTILAVAAFVAGLHELLGEAGIALGALTMILLGNPFSAVGSAPEVLPQPVGWIGGLMPPGAGGSLLRSTGLFDGAGAAGHVAVLGAWAATGLALLAGAALRGRRTATAVPVPATA